MSKLQKGDNPCAYISEIRDEQKGMIIIPPKQYKIGIAPTDVEKDKITITKLETYEFKEIDGKIYRIGKNGIKYPPISKKEYEAIKKSREQNEQGMEH